MHTTTSRDGDPLVLVPGAFSYRRYPGLVKLARLLAARFTVYSYDRWGRGDSGDTKPYAVEGEIEDLAAVIDAAGGHAHVWGLSSGAVLALEAAAAGLPIRRLAVHEPPFVVAFVLTMLRLMPKAWKTLTAVASSLPYDAAIMRGYQEGRPLPADQWASVTMPTLVMCGASKETQAFFVHAAQAVAAALPDARLLQRRGLGHTKTLNAPVIADTLTEFLTGPNNAARTGGHHA